MKKLTDREKTQISAAIAELDAIGPGGTALSECWTRIQRAGLMLRGSLDGQPPTHPEATLIAAAERCERFNPLRPLLEDQTTDAKTHQEVLDWKRRRAEARAKADAELAGFEAKREEVIAKIVARAAKDAEIGDGRQYPLPSFVLIDNATAEQEGLTEAERRALLARVACNEVERAFGDWRLRAWCDGRLRSIKGD